MRKHISLSFVTNLREGEVDSVGERRDDQSSVEPHVLVTVAEGSRTLPDVELVGFPVPVEPQLALPLKLLGIQDTVTKI